ncbi:MAG: hypothetical protein Q4C72_07895, partial [Eubacteriales bacterium]|nr:hypothetical protein [Eubacteriales bacterium]
MNMKKLAPIALALTVATTAAAGAANAETVKLRVPSSVVSQAQQKLLQQLCGKYNFSFCGQQNGCPVVKPEFKPETKPEETPDVK